MDVLRFENRAHPSLSEKALKAILPSENITGLIPHPRLPAPCETHYTQS